MTVETSPEPKAGVWSALVAFLKALWPTLPSRDTMWMIGLWGLITGMSAVGGAMGWHWVAPTKEIKVIDQAAVVATQQAESARANERIAFIAENRDLDGLADKCAAAVKDAIRSGKKQK